LKAAILAGGAGTRLQPITEYVPKSLLPLGGRYVIEYVLNYLHSNGITDVALLISNSELELLRNHLGDGRRFGLNVEYSVAERIGTAGALKAASDLLGERFIVYYGDVLTSMNLKAMIEFHTRKRAVATVAMSTSVPIDYGVGRVADDGRLTYFEEKPVLKEYPISIGVDLFEREVLSYCGMNMDIAQHVIPRLMEEQKPVFAFLTRERHYDIGTFKTLEEVRVLADRREGIFRANNAAG
jgi:NDP-sugar pyrophosphorylase family protein